MIPVYIVTGLLGTGKSTLINQELRERKKLGSTEIITFELGNIVHIKEPLTIEPDDIEMSPAHVILLKLDQKKYGLNGMVCFHFSN